MGIHIVNAMHERLIAHMCARWHGGVERFTVLTKHESDGKAIVGDAAHRQRLSSGTVF